MPDFCVIYYCIDCGFHEKEEEKLKKHIENDHAYIYICINIYMQVSYILVIDMIIMKKTLQSLYLHLQSHHEGMFFTVR